MSTFIGTPPGVPISGVIRAFSGSYTNATSTPTSIAQAVPTAHGANTGYRIMMQITTTDTDRITLRLTFGGTDTDLQITTPNANSQVIIMITLFPASTTSYMYQWVPLRTGGAPNTDGLQGASVGIGGAKTWSQLTNINVMGDNNGSASTLSVGAVIVEQVGSIV